MADLVRTGGGMLYATAVTSSARARWKALHAGQLPGGMDAARRPDFTPS